jgi:monoterpene epsilon-lactone hydrolase
MSSGQQQVRQLWREFLNALAPPAGLRESRRGFEELCARFPIPESASIRPVDAAGVPCLLVSADGAPSNAMIVWAHSGGYVLGSAHGYRSFAATLSEATAADVLLVDYRLAPEHPYPAALEDFLAATRWAMSSYRPEQVVVGGDSAGGGLACAAALHLANNEGPNPAAAMFLSPFTDLTLSGRSMDERETCDPVLDRATLAGMGALYRQDFPAKDPSVSPLFGDFSKVPPMLVLVGTDEVLHDDATRLAERAAAAGADVRLLVGEGQTHIWPLFATMLPEGQAAIEDIAEFVRARVPSSPATHV